MLYQSSSRFAKPESTTRVVVLSTRRRQPHLLSARKRTAGTALDVARVVPPWGSLWNTRAKAILMQLSG